MSFIDFSRSILQSGDIDPDYMFIREFSRRKKFSKAKMLQWIRLKVVIYNSVSELHYLLHKESFKWLKFGNERNKSRNRAAENLKAITEAFPDLEYVEDLMIGPNPLKKVADVKGFGPWAAWKFLDLLDCCMGYNFEGSLGSQIDFRDAYEYPLRGLLLVNQMEEDTDLLKDDKVYKKCLNKVLKMVLPLNKLRTPHNENNGVRINEVETLLCKYHSYVHGHYHPGEDITRLMNDIRNSPYPEINKFPSLW